MPAVHRLRLAFLLLVAAFLVLVGFGATSLAIAGQAGLAIVVIAAGLAGLAAGTITWLVVRKEEDEPAAVQPAAMAMAPPVAVAARKPLRVQAMPVAELPPEYVAAVTRGMRARTSALRAQTREMHH